MIRALIATLILALSACATPAAEDESAAPAIPEGPQATIPFAASGGIRDFRAENDGTLLIESAQGRWYRATFFGSCPEVRYAETIGFMTEPSGALDRYSGIIARGRECRFRSLVEAPDPAAAAEAAPAAESPAPQ